VVIGNPPYKEKAKGRGGWIEEGSDGREAPLDRWMPPAAWRVGTHAKHLKNLYVYFWRWATWKVFGTGLKASTGLDETERAGIVCFITVAGFLNGPGFEKMRDDLRRTCRDIWVIDCSPEGHQPDVPTRIFQGVQQPVCIVLAARTRGTNEGSPARVRFRALPRGRREEKFAALAEFSLNDDGWTDCPAGWRDPFLPKSGGAWGEFPTLDDLFVYNGSGVMPGRTWVIAPDAASLRDRWSVLTRERDPEKKSILFHPHMNGDKTTTKGSKKGLGQHEHRPEPVTLDAGACITPTRYAVRSFDRQWIIPDNRLINRPNPRFWEAHSSRQVYLTGLERMSPSSGPAITFTGLIPDLDHYHGRGGRVYPLWSDSSATQPNVKPALLRYLSAAFQQAVTGDDLVAYLAAVMAHSCFTKRFAADLVRPGLRLPLSSNAALFAEATEIGREVIWIQTFGERFSDPAAGRPARSPRLPPDAAPSIPISGAIPGPPEPLPEVIEYDSEKRRLYVGKGFVDNVPKAVWEFEISGRNVLRQWFSYRRFDRSRPLIGDKRPPSPLDRIQPEGWIAEYTTELIDLLHVLGRLVAIEPRQAAVLARICAAPTFEVEVLRAGGALSRPTRQEILSKELDIKQGSLLDFT
jgi:hypothetical protein